MPIDGPSPTVTAEPSDVVRAMPIVVHEVNGASRIGVERSEIDRRPGATRAALPTRMPSSGTCRAVTSSSPAQFGGPSLN